MTFDKAYQCFLKGYNIRRPEYTWTNPRFYLNKDSPKHIDILNVDDILADDWEVYRVIEGEKSGDCFKSTGLLIPYPT